MIVAPRVCGVRGGAILHQGRRTPMTTKEKEMFDLSIYSCDRITMEGPVQAGKPAHWANATTIDTNEWLIEFHNQVFMIVDIHGDIQCAW